MEARKAENVRSLLVDIFEANDPSSGDAETATLPRLLERGTDEIMERDLTPEIKIELLHTLDTVYQNIADFEKAEEMIRQSLELSTRHFGPASVNTAKSYTRLGGIKNDLGNYREGKHYLVTARNILDRQPGSYSTEYARLYHHLRIIEEGMSNYDSSLIYFQQALDHIELQNQNDTARYIDVMKSLARAIHREGNYSKQTTC